MGRWSYSGLLVAVCAVAASVAAGCAREEVTQRPPREGQPPSPIVAETGGVPLGLPELGIDLDDPQMQQMVALGEQLYFDPRLSRDQTVSCASCHSPRFGFSDGRPVSIGIHGQKGGRNAPTTINRAWSGPQFWDGRAASLEDQALGPIQNPIEMGFTLEELEERLNAIEGYRNQFQAVFETDVTAENVGKAIAAFERTLLSGDSDWDRDRAGDENALSPEAQRGRELFFGKANCFQCHTPPNFTDEEYHNLGVGTQWPEPDVGRFAVTGEDRDWAAFKTPTLRDVELSAPYMHDGSLRTLDEVVELYNSGGIPNQHLSPHMKPLGLTDQEESDLVAFLRALTGRDRPEMAAPPLPE